MSRRESVLDPLRAEQKKKLTAIRKEDIVPALFQLLYCSVISKTKG